MEKNAKYFREAAWASSFHTDKPLFSHDETPSTAQ